MEKSSFIYYFDWAQELLKLPDDLRLRIDDAVKRYVLYAEEPTDREVLYSMFGLIRNRIDEDKVKWQEKCNKNRDNVRKRWGENTTVYNRYERIRTLPIVIMIVIVNIKKVLSYQRKTGFL